MKEKVLVRISLPMGDMAYDVRLPYDVDCAVAAGIISEMFKKVTESNEPSPVSFSPALWWKSKGVSLHEGKSLREYGITDSDQLLLI